MFLSQSKLCQQHSVVTVHLLEHQWQSFSLCQLGCSQAMLRIVLKSAWIMDCPASRMDITTLGIIYSFLVDISVREPPWERLIYQYRCSLWAYLFSLAEQAKLFSCCSWDALSGPFEPLQLWTPLAWIWVTSSLQQFRWCRSYSLCNGMNTSLSLLETSCLRYSCSF